MPSMFHTSIARLRKGEIVVATLEVSPDNQAIATLRRWLSSEERYQADRLRSEHDRAAYVGAHALLSALASSLLGERGIAWELRCAQRGMKPYICSDAAPCLSVSLSHTDGLAAVAVSLGGEVGVDVERVRDVEMSREEMLDLLTPREFGLLQDGPTRNRSFLRLWTRKEACLKALGVGLSVPPGHVDSSDGTHFSIQDMETQVWGTDLMINLEWVGCVCAVTRPTAIHAARVDLTSLGHSQPKTLKEVP